MFCTVCATDNPPLVHRCGACGITLPSAASPPAAVRSSRLRRATGVALAMLPVAAALMVFLAVRQDRIEAGGTAGTALVVSLLAGDDRGAARAAARIDPAAGSLARQHLAETRARAAGLASEAGRRALVGNLDGAADLLGTAVRLLPGDAELLAQRNDLHARQRAAASRAYLEALSDGDWLTAERQLAALIALEPGNPARERALAALRADHSPLAVARARALWLVGPDGGDGTLLTAEVPVSRPVWSPDRSRLAFVSSDPYDGRAPGTLYVIDADGGNLRPLHRSAHANAVPTWSPDGEAIALTSVEGWDLRREAGRLAVHVVDVATGVDRDISRATRRHATSPVWSPTGEAVAFISRPILDDPLQNPLSGPAAVVLWSVADGTTRNLTGGALPHTMRTLWSPDGTSLLVATRLPGLRGETSSPDAALVLIDAATGTQATLEEEIEAATAGWAPAWSPDGTTLAWVDGPRTVVLRDSAGGTRRIDTRRFLSGALTWSPAGDALLAVAADPADPSARIEPAAAEPVQDVPLAYDTEWPTGTPQWAASAKAPPAAVAGVGLDH